MKQKHRIPHARSNAGSTAVAQALLYRAIESNMVHIVRRALRERCVDTTLHRRILSEACRAGFKVGSAGIADDELIHAVAQRLSARLVIGLRTPMPKSRGDAETVRD